MAWYSKLGYNHQHSMAVAAGTRLGPYEISGPLGAGGMGEVYRARDSRLDREVAIKVLPPHLANDPQALARFEREAKAIAALSHPNILAIHDFGSHLGNTYAVTELLEGETLRSWLARSAVPWKKAVEIASGVADGLSAAHAKGLIHRDLKPENIFLTKDGRVKILDFGLVRTSEISSAQNHEAITLTQDGIVMGTPGYMSPEQVRAGAVSAGSDIFSLGCVLYEMVAGQRAFVRETAAQTMTAILEAKPPDLGKAAPTELEDVISRCLEKNPQQRFHSAGDLTLALRAVLAGSSAPAPQVDMPEAPSLAVLPFVNMSAEPDNEYFSDGLTEELISALAKIEGLRVVGRTSVFQFKGKAVDAREVGARLKVRALLDGSVRKAGDRLRISVQLINVSDGCQLWSERYQCEMKDIFAVQDEITGKVVNALRVRLFAGTVQVAHTPPNVDAYNLYLKGRHQQTRRTPDGLHKSIANFQEAIALDPRLAAAYCGLSESYSIMAYNELLPSRELMPKAKAAAQRALELDGTLAAAHALLGDVMSGWEWDWEGGEEEFRHAIRLNPGDALGHFLYASSNLGPRGRWREALHEMRRALELDPVSPAMNRDLGQLLFMQRDYDQAIEQFRRTRDLDPDFIGVYYWLGRAYEQKNLPEKALAAFEQRLLFGTNTRVLAAIAHLHAISGNRADALERLRQLEESTEGGRVPPLDLATVYVGLGETDQAFEFLTRAFEERSAAIYQLKVDPVYDSLRDDARFRALLDKMGLR